MIINVNHASHNIGDKLIIVQHFEGLIANDLADNIGDTLINILHF